MGMQETIRIEDDESIPSFLLQAAAEIAAVCRKHGLRQMEAKLRPSFDQKCSHELSLFWSAGRHNVDRDEATLTYNKIVRIQVPASPPSTASQGESE